MNEIRDRIRTCVKDELIFPNGYVERVREVADRMDEVIKNKDSGSVPR